MNSEKNWYNKVSKNQHIINLTFHQMQHSWTPHSSTKERDLASGWFNSSPQPLHEEVIRKNNQIIKNFLGKLNDVFSRLEEYDSSLKTLNQKLVKIGQHNENLQFQFRSTYLDSTRRHDQLASEVAAVKGVLRMPSVGTPHEAYLSSDFFRERATNVNSRMRENMGRGKLRHRTNLDAGQLGVVGEMQKDTPFSIYQNTQANSRHRKNESDLPCIDSEQQLSKPVQSYLRSEGCRASIAQESELLPRLEAVEQRLQAISQKSGEWLGKDELQLGLCGVREEVEGRIAAALANRKRECEWNHIDFEELQAYLDQKVKEALDEKVGKKFFETSMTNLKQAWQQEEKSLYEAIDRKVDEVQIASIKQKIAELALRMDISPSASLKASIVSLNPFSHNRHQLPRGSMREGEEAFIRRSNQHKKSRGGLQYSNSLSTVRRSTDKRETKELKNGFEDLLMTQASMMEKTWKDKVTEVIGEEKMKKKTKIFT